MTQFLKNHAKLISILVAAFSFLFVILACFYIMPYNDTALNFDLEIKKGLKESMTTGNEYLAAFFLGTEAGPKGPITARFSDLYQTLYQFNVSLQTANNLVLYTGVVGLVMLCVMFFCANASRKKYYRSNLISGIVCPAISIVVAVVALVMNFLPMITLSDSSKYNIINWGALGNRVSYENAIALYNAGDTSQFVINSTPLIIYGVCIILFIVVWALMIVYHVWRYKLTQKELNVTEKVVDENA